MRIRRIKWAADYLDNARLRVKEPVQKAGQWKTGNEKLHLEIGTGKGNYSLQMASMNPKERFIAVEKNESAAGIAAKKFDESGLENLHFIYGDAAEVSTWFVPGEVDVIHLNFSDPWPKKRNAKRRLSAPGFLEQYRAILSEDGEIQMKTDNASLFEYSILSMLSAGYVLQDISVDFRRDEHPEDAVTEYEQKFIEKGQPVYRSVWKKR